MLRHKGITKLDVKKYRVRVRTTDPRTGKPKDIKRICRGTLKEALAMQRDLLDEAQQGGPKARVTFTKYARSWLQRKVRTIKPATADKYIRDLTQHILPALGDLYIDTVRPSDVADFLAEQLQHYANWTVINRLRLLRTISKDAIADAVTDRDFCARVKPPPGRIYTAAAPNCLTADQVGALAIEIPPQWYALWATIAFTGMRFGEASALMWPDIDYDQGLIHIERTNWKGQVNEPKTPSSRRSVPMVPELAEILRAHHAQMIADKHPGLKHGWVFPTRRGTLHKGAPLGPVIRKALERAGIDVHLTTHGLRRTFNNLARRVATGQVVRAIVGHTTEAMTDHYSVIEADEKQAAQSAVLQLVRQSSTVTNNRPRLREPSRRARRVRRRRRRTRDGPP